MTEAITWDGKPSEIDAELLQHYEDHVEDVTLMDGTQFTICMGEINPHIERLLQQSGKLHRVTVCAKWS
jgi:hypothetical protein